MLCTRAVICFEMDQTDNISAFPKSRKVNLLKIQAVFQLQAAQRLGSEPIIEITSCEREMLLKGVTPLFLPVKIPAAENQEGRGRG